MKTYYEIHLGKHGKVESHIFTTKKEKDLWLVDYFTYGQGSTWGRKQYEHYLAGRARLGQKAVHYDKFILAFVREAVTIHTDYTVIIIRKKKVEKILKK